MGAEISIHALPDHDKRVQIEAIDENPIVYHLASEYDHLPNERKKDKHAVVREYRIYTVGQGILIESRRYVRDTCTFKEHLAHGSWYDIEVCVEGFPGDGTSQFYSFLTRGVYCTGTPPVLILSDLLLPDKMLEHSAWTCTNKMCNHTNYSSIPICKGCSTHSVLERLHQLATYPLLSIPLSATIAVLTCGKACVTEAPEDIVEAITESTLVIVHIALTPVLVFETLTCIVRHIPNNRAKSSAQLIAIYPYQNVCREIMQLTSAYGIKIEIARKMLNYYLQQNLPALLPPSKRPACGALPALRAPLRVTAVHRIPATLRAPVPQVTVALRVPVTQVAAAAKNADNAE